ncbi:Riboflavin transporter RfnT [archaeon HR01]|nr:Riboflavin transporter RfnT [archaeon HR01]
MIGRLHRRVARNLLLLATAQGLQTIVIQIFTIHVPITILLLGGSTTLAGLGTSLMWGGRLATAFHMGRLMDRVGRIPVISAGLAISGITAAAAGLATYSSNLPLYLAAVLAFGIGRGMADYARIAAGDMLPPERRGVGTGILLTGSMAGTLVATPVIYMATALVDGVEPQTSVAAELAAITFAAAAVLAALLVTPDPLTIARDLGRYYPESVHDPPASRTMPQQSLRKAITPPVISAYISSAITTGMMVAFMSLGSLLLHIHHIGTTTISAVVTVHVLGMYAFSIPLGKLADSVGRLPTMAGGVLVCGLGAFLTAYTGDLAVVTAGMFLVGVGWSAATVSSVALISDETEPEIRGKVLGANDTAIALASLAIPLAAAYILEVLGGLSLAAMGLAAGVAAATASNILHRRRRL